MNVIVSIEHPAWAHQFRYIIKALQNLGHQVKVVAVKKDHDTELLEKFNVSYELVAHSTGKNIIQKAFLLLSISCKIFFICLRFKPTIFIGRASPMMAINSFIFRKPHVIFEDTEHSKISLFFCKLFSTAIITPISFRHALGIKQHRAPLYKELFYLHPAHFTPDHSFLQSLPINLNEKYVVIRFVAWEADHDFGHTGLKMEVKREAIKTFNKYGKVFITSESPLPAEFEPYRLNLSPENIHHVLYYAQLVYGESSTMASESAILGTHAIFCDFEGRGYTDEQETQYQLVFNFKLDIVSQKASIQKAIELLEDEDLWELGKKKRKKLLNEKIDGSSFMLNFILKMDQEGQLTRNYNLPVYK